MPKSSFQKGAIKISTFAGIAIIAAVVVIASTIVVIKYREMPKFPIGEGQRIVSSVSVITPESAPSVTPVVDETVDRQTYEGKIETNIFLPFSIKYPSNWNIESGDYDRNTLYAQDSNGNEYQMSLGWGGHGVEGMLQGAGDTGIINSKEVIYNNYKASKDFTYKKSNGDLADIMIVFNDYQGAIFEIGFINIPNKQQNQNIIKQIDEILNTIEFNK